MLSDLRLALRILAKSPGSTALAVTALAVAIGANSAIFSLLNTALLKLLPVANPQQLVMLTDPNASMILGGMLAGERSLLGYEEFTQLRDRSQTMSGLCASQLSLERWPLRIARDPQEQARGRLVSENYFTVLGVQPAIGRLFAQNDATGLGQDPYVVISYAYWQRRFGGHRSVLGTPVRIRGATLIIVGVAAQGFRGETVGQDPDLWLPMLMQPLVTPGLDRLHDFMGHSQDKLMWLHVLGRRKSGITIAQSQAELNVLFRQILEAGYKATREPVSKEALDQHIRVRPLQSGAFHGRDEFSEQWTVLFALAALVLLIACANIANLLLARAAARTREVAIRRSMGAPPARIVRQFLIESLLLALLGGIAGLFVAALADRVLLLLLSHPGAEFALAPEIDVRVLAFIAGTVLLVALLFGLAPAVRAATVARSEGLQESTRSTAGSRQRRRFAQTLVMAQIALSFLLLFGSGLFLQTLANLQTVSLGYPRENLLLLDADAPAVKERPVRLDQAIAARLLHIPGVRAVTYSDRPLLNGFDGSFAVAVEGFTPLREADLGSAGSFVGPGYLSTIGIPLVAGHDIAPRDGPGSPPVCVINEAFAREFFAGRDPLGKHLTVNSTSMEIIGIARDARVNSLRGPIEAKFYAASGQNSGAFSFAIRTTADPERLMNALRQNVMAVDANLSLAAVQTLDQKIAALNAQPRLIAGVSTAFAAIALFLAALGTYAVISFNVARRRNEFGIRMALGARSRRITAMVLQETAFLIAAGLLAGVSAASLAVRILNAQLQGVSATGPRWSLANYQHVDSAIQLYGVSAFNPPAIAAAIFVLTAAALLAACLPAARAAQVNPASALRHE